MHLFKLNTGFEPKGDQPKAIASLVDGIKAGLKNQVLLGVTGSGKTFTIANVIEKVNKPTLVMAPNKTLAAQLFFEFKELFPDNAVEYFVSYYDYYQPEAYVPETDTYIEKDSSINEEIDKLRHRATYSLLERRDVIIVASVSCIYGIGSPEAYSGMIVVFDRGEVLDIRDVMKKLIEMQYIRNDYDFFRGTFRVRGDVIDIFPPYEDNRAIRVEFFGDNVENISSFDPVTGEIFKNHDRITVYPASHYVASEDRLKNAITGIRRELKERLEFFEREKKLLFAERLKQRTLYDIELLEEMGYCKGIENYSRYLDGRPAGVPPFTLLDYFPKDFLIVIDESHLTVPQIGGMYEGDRSRKQTLVDNGFRLPSALDNRPLKFEEFEKRINYVIYVSATPGPYELKRCENLVEQIIRPTGLIDPEVIVKPAREQVKDILEEARKVISRGERVLISTLTKRMAEDLSAYFKEQGIKTEYLHSDIDTLDRVKIIKGLRKGEFDVLIGINLLREGLDLPEVSLVAIMDADKEGFLRSETSLIQTCGRAARNINGRVIFYADKITPSMERAIGEAERRRKIQLEYNRANNITPETVKKNINEDFGILCEKDYFTIEVSEEKGDYKDLTTEALDRRIKVLERKMKKLAKNMQFEEAAKVRDEIKTILANNVFR
ncbi:MAG: excinuclease ABC subunit UvrB [Proteobacteria bacterium]|nr:excinuclease ABC subunit UvrB [Pseudomonadota bacterium]